ncbi:outer membrane lipoprotein chaperone LolA [Thalassotalea montiporae]
MKKNFVGMALFTSMANTMLTTVLTATLSVNSFAVEVNEQVLNSASANELVSPATNNQLVNNEAKTELLAKLAQLENLAASFTQNVYDVDNNLLQTGQGQFTLAAPNYLKWQTTSPEESTLVSDGETLWLFDPFIEQVTAYSLANSISNTPILLLTSTDESLWQQYEISQMANEAFKVVAKSEDAQVKELLLAFSGDVLSGFTIVDATGQHSEFLLENIAANQTLASDVFSFQVPEGMLLDDQR